MIVAAFVVSIVALFVALFVGLYAARVAHEVEESGFKAEEQFKGDLVALLAALRSLIVKGTLTDQDSTPRSVAKEIDTLRTFQASTSGLALANWAARQGAGGGPEDGVAGRWRTLSLNLGNLAGAAGNGTKEDNLMLRSWATAVELTLEDLAEDSVRAIGKNIGNLPGTFASLKESRANDILLQVWFSIYQSQEESNNPKNLRRRLEYLRDSGVDDIDIDMWLALLAGNVDDFKTARNRGADQSATIGQVLARHEGDALRARVDSTPEEETPPEMIDIASEKGLDPGPLLQG